FAALADALVTLLNAEVHFIGSADDRAAMNRIDELSERAHVFHIGLPLPHVVAAISICDLFIGNDSGLSHIAAAVGTPMIVLWGPVNLSMARPARESQC